MKVKLLQDYKTYFGNGRARKIYDLKKDQIIEDNTLAPYLISKNVAVEAPCKCEEGKTKEEEKAQDKPKSFKEKIHNLQNKKLDPKLQTKKGKK